MWKLVIASMLLIALCGCVSDPDGDAGGEPVRLPMEMWMGSPVVPVTVAGRGPYMFFLDSGAGTTVIDRALGETLEFTKVGETTIGSPVGEPVAAEVLELSDVEIGGFPLERIECVMLDLADMMGSGAGAPRGVLSTRSFPGHTITLDFPQRVVELRRGSLPAADGAEIFDFPGDDGMPGIPITVGGVELDVHLDSGSPAFLGLPLAVAERLPLVSEPVVIGQARLVGATVEVSGARLDGEVRIGRYRFTDPQLGFLEGAEIGNAGMQLLQRFAVTLDHENRRLRLVESGAAESSAAVPGVTGSKSPSATPMKVVMGGGGTKRYGIRFMGGLDLANLRVAGVDPASPAELGGVRAGDVIIGVNGRSVADMERGEFSSVMRSSPLSLVVLRDGEEHQLELTLE
jgi:hypothetical protein